MSFTTVVVRHSMYSTPIIPERTVKTAPVPAHLDVSTAFVNADRTSLPVSFSPSNGWRQRLLVQIVQDSVRLWLIETLDSDRHSLVDPQGLPLHSQFGYPSQETEILLLYSRQ